METHFMEKYFNFDHLPKGKMRTLSNTFYDQARLLMYEVEMDERLRIKALWKLWESKNLAVLALSPNG